MEIAWRSNAGEKSGLDEKLSNWNQRVSSGELAAVVMNATITETGERLLLATTRFDRGPIAGRARVDAAELHGQRDVTVVTAARLSATFPYVTPASRADSDGPQPHIVDGGYYDNYGMATLVEWLDEALPDRTGVKSVLVLRVHGAAIKENLRDQRYSGTRGWFYQALAPVLALIHVRSAGQVSHNDVELGLLEHEWARRGIPIHSLAFEFPDANAPLSWHLTSNQQAAINQAWEDCEPIQIHRNSVWCFLQGEDVLQGCACPSCRTALT